VQKGDVDFKSSSCIFLGHGDNLPSNEEKK